MSAAGLYKVAHNWIISTLGFYQNYTCDFMCHSVCLGEPKCDSCFQVQEDAAI